MSIFPQDAYSGSDELYNQDMENQRLDDSTFEPGLQLEKIGDFDQAEKIEAVLKELIDQVAVEKGLAGEFSSDEILRRAEEAIAHDSFKEENAAKDSLVILSPDSLEMK
ncbi:MAG: hypothetical protein JXA25_10240 [Anaerolineales bacterium]|nr:hypothetical protein [Anaerolineales bacterium]